MYGATLRLPSGYILAVLKFGVVRHSDCQCLTDNLKFLYDKLKSYISSC